MHLSSHSKTLNLSPWLKAQLANCMPLIKQLNQMCENTKDTN